MKKIISLFLVITVFFLFPASVVSAQEDGHPPQKYIIGMSNGYTIYAYDGPILPREARDQIGKYVFEGANWLSTYPFDSNLGIYVEKGNEVYSLAIAYQNNLINLDEAAEMIDGFDMGSTGFGVQLIGDLNFNGTVEVEDVLQLQKQIVKIPGSFRDIVSCDCNKDGMINTQDVLIMQKVIANMYEIV